MRSLYIILISLLTLTGWGQQLKPLIQVIPGQVGGVGNLINVTGKNITDPDALAFIDSTGITNYNQQLAIDYLVTSLKAVGLWDSLYAIYPLVGSTEDNHKYNLKNPQNTDEAFRLTFSGTVTHDVNGLLPASAYANTHFNPSLYSGNNFSISYYTPSDTGGNYEDMGAVKTYNTRIVSKYLTAGVWKSYFNARQQHVFKNNNSSGMFMLSSDDSTLSCYVDGVRVGNISNSGNYSLATDNIYLMAENNNGTAASKSIRRLQFASIGKAMTQRQANDFYRIVKNYELRLSRPIEEVDGRHYGYSVRNSWYPIDSTGVHSPATANNDALRTWDSLNLGALICYNMDMYNGGLIHPTYVSPYDFTPKNVNARTWAGQMKEAGVKYAVLTLSVASGYMIFDNPYPYPAGLVDRKTMLKFDIGNSPQGDTAVVDKFFTAMRDSGIVPIPYVNLCYHTNLTGNTAMVSFTAAQKKLFTNWFSKTVQYIIKRWNCDYIWIDYCGVAYDCQKIYDAVKSSNPNCLVISNSTSDISFGLYPYDIGSNEELYWGSETDATVLSPNRSHGGTSYYVPQEGCMQLLSDGLWYSATQPTTVRSQSEVQAFYNRVHNLGSNVLIGLAADQTGVISQNQIDLIKGIDTSGYVPPTYNAAATALFNRMGTAPDATMKSAISQWYDTIQHYHIDDTLDVSYCFAVHDSADARLDWIRSNKSAIKVGTVPFVANEGFTVGGSGGNKCLRANYNPSADKVHYRQNSASIAVYVRSSSLGTNPFLHIYDGSRYAHIYPISTTTYIRLNGSAAGSFGNSSSINGYTCFTRTSSTNVGYSRNTGTYTNVTNNSTGVPNQLLGFVIGANNTNGTIEYNAYNQQISFVHIGGQLTSIQNQKLFEADERFLDVFGKGVN